MFRDFPYIRQHDSMQCGVACLAMVCKYFGRDVSLSFLSELCGITAEGVSLLAMNDAASQLGFSSVCAKVSVSALEDAQLPCILYWNRNHFVVLYKTKGDSKYYVADPGKGLCKYTRDDFLKKWLSVHDDEEDKGIAMFLKPTDAFYRMKDRAGSSQKRKSLFFLISYIIKYRKHYGRIVWGMLAGCVIQFALPFLTQSIVDVGIGKRDIGLVWIVLLGQLMLTASYTAIDIVCRRALLRISQSINVSLVNDFFVKLLKLPMSFFDTKLTGDIMQRMNDHGRVNRFLTQQMLSVIFLMLTFAAFSIVLAFYDIHIFSAFIAGSALYGLWVYAFMRQRKTLDYELFEQEAANSSMTYEFITSMQEIKLQGCENRKCSVWKGRQADLFGVRMRILKMQQRQEAGGVFIREVKNIVITVMAATAVIKGEMTLGMMLAVQYIIGQLNSPLEQLMGFIYMLQDVNTSLERINEVHQMENEDGADGHRTSVKDADLGITFRNVTFRYDSHALRPTLDNVSLSIPYGKVTAIVGASGCGKTTLLRLMLGYYKVKEGAVEIGSVDISEMNKRWWRSQCGVVMQDGAIFSDSIERNIAVNDECVNHGKLMEATEIACIRSFVMSLPLRFNTKIGRDGLGLSQGQKQRMLIARAVYKNPDYIFLDEATNSLDANNEHDIVDNLKDFYKGKTVVIVAHRLSTVKDADQIVVMDDGRIVETGTHESLTATHGVYYNLVKNQLELGV